MYDVDKFMKELEAKNASQPEFIQAVREVIETVVGAVNANFAYRHEKILERITEPDRVITFKVEWEDDQGDVQINRGCRVQFSNVLGPYKGGLRFHVNVSIGTFKFLAFEQTLKNSLTTLPLGGGKGGSDFSPKGKSDNEIRRFCRAFMTELQKYVGSDLDIPAGDIGVGGREIGYLYGQLKRLRTENPGVITGKGLGWGGSLLRPEATGFGAVYYAQAMLKEASDRLAGKTVAISGFGNVAWGVAMKASQLGAKVVTLSGPDGYVLDVSGVGTKEKWDSLLELRGTNNDVIAPYAEEYGVDFFPNKKPWETKVDIAFPCAIQNELDEDDARALVENGCRYVVETSNMGCTPGAIALLQRAGVNFAPGKAANAGGVAVSGLEMSQNSMRLRWSSEEVDERLKEIMRQIHEAGVRYGRRNDGYIDYVKGSNIAGVVRVAEAMLDLGY
ncbi:NADP-specific glutamate dehydrogenase [Myxococcota bacterium]